MDNKKIEQLLRSAYNNLDMDDNFMQDTKKRMCEGSDETDKFNVNTTEQSNISKMDIQRKNILIFKPSFIASTVAILIIIAIFSVVVINNAKLRGDMPILGKYFTHTATQNTNTPNTATPNNVIATPEITTPNESPKPLPIGIKQFGGSEDEKLLSICNTSDGGYVAVGESNSSDGDIPGNNGYTDAIIAKFDMNGNKQWIKNYGGVENESFSSVIQTSDGGFVVTGELMKAATDAPYIHAIIVKYDKDGNEIWANISYEDNYESLKCVIQTSDGGYVAVGSTFLYQGHDALLVKYDNNGNRLWHKSYTGLFVESFNSVIQTDDGAYVAVGYSTDNKDGDDSIGFDALIAKFDKNGDKLWWNNYSEQHRAGFSSIIQTSNGELFVGGYSSTFSSISSALIAKFDSNGNKLWLKNYFDIKLSKINSIIKTNDNSLIAIGYSYIEAEELTRQFVFKLDNEGSLIWLNVVKLDIVNKKYYTGLDMYSITQLKDGNYVACGKYTFFTTVYKYKAVIFNFDSNGVLK